MGWITVPNVPKHRAILTAMSHPQLRVMKEVLEQIEDLNESYERSAGTSRGL